jgi:hypothetical protein
MEEQQVQRREPLLAIDEEPDIAVLLHVDERPEEERLTTLTPRGP